MLDISKFLVQHEINFVDGFLLDSDYKNIGTSAINLGDYEWAKEFIETYKQSLIPQARESAYSYLLAFLCYSTKDYKAALQALYNVVFTNWTYHAGAKVIQVRIYYELNETDVMEALLNSMKAYLSRKEQLGYHRDNYENIVRLFRKLMNLNPYDKKEKEAFRKELESSKVTEKEWLLDRVK